MNCTAYIFGSLGDGYVQYPDDYTHDLFFNQSQKLAGNTFFAIHRDGNLMHYSGFFRVGSDAFIGFGIVTNNVMVSSHHVLMEVFQNTLDYIVARGELLHRIDLKIEVGDAKLSDQRANQHAVDHLRYLVKQMDSKYSIPLPPLSFELGLDSEIWFRYDNASEQVATESARYAYTYLSDLGERVTKKPQTAKAPTEKQVKKKKNFLALLIVLFLIIAGLIAYPRIGKYISADTTSTERTDERTTSQKDLLRQAAEYYNAKEYEKAFESYKMLANNGNTTAQYHLGQLYRLGQGVAEDASEAARWYETAGNNGQAEAQYRLGVMMYYGDGIPKNRRQGLEWIRKAAKQGHEKALEILGKPTN